MFGGRGGGGGVCRAGGVRGALNPPLRLLAVPRIVSSTDSFADSKLPTPNIHLERLQRQRATVANLHRLGVRNALVCCHDGRKIPFKGVDRVLLDAPCSGASRPSSPCRFSFGLGFQDAQYFELSPLLSPRSSTTRGWNSHLTPSLVLSRRIRVVRPTPSHVGPTRRTVVSMLLLQTQFLGSASLVCLSASR